MTTTAASFLSRNGRPLTADYRPSVYRTLRYRPDHPRGFTILDAERMRWDPRISFGLRILRAPLSQVKWEVKAANPEVGKWVDRTLKKIWSDHLTALAQSMIWGHAGGEPLWDLDEKTDLIEFTHLRELHPLDMIPLVTSAGFWGVRVRGGKSQKGHLDLPSPRCLWVTHEPEYGGYYGTSRLASAWEPWSEKANRHGARDSRRQWYLTCAFNGGAIRHPMGYFAESDGSTKSYQALAEEILEKKMNGGVLAMPNTKDDVGNFLWEYIPPQINGSGVDIREYPQDLDNEIFQGMNIPKEVVEAAETGSGWAGRTVPFLVFLTSEDGIAQGWITSVDKQLLRPGVEANFGPNQNYAIVVKSLVPPPEEQGPGGGGPGGGGPGGPKVPGQPYRGPKGGQGVVGNDGKVHYGAARLGLMGDEWHGPEPPGEGWQLAGEGPHGGKIWRRTGGRASTAAPEEPKGRVARMVAAITGPLAQLVPASVKNAVARVKGAVVERMKKRYGERATSIILKAAVYSGAVPIVGTQPATLAVAFIAAETARLIGLIGNTPPVQMALGGSLTFEQIVEAVREFYAEFFAEMGEEPPEMDEDELGESVQEALDEEEDGDDGDDTVQLGWKPFATKRGTVAAFNDETGRKAYGKEAQRVLSGGARKAARAEEMATRKQRKAEEKRSRARQRQEETAARRKAKAAGGGGKDKAAGPAPWEKGGKAEPGQVHNAPTGALNVDPDRFQFKLNVKGPYGVGEELQQVKTWNPDFAGVISVWQDPKDGKTYVVNGHHRYELAHRLGVKDLAVRYIKAETAQEARAIGALVNIAEGRGTAVDAAKFMRDTGSKPEDLEKHGVSLKGKVAADAAALTRLSDKLFDRVARGTLDADKALAVAKHLPDHNLQEQLFRLLDKREDEGKDLSLKVVEEMAREMAATPTATKTEASLFGDIESEESLFVPKNELKAHIRGELGREVADFQAVASKRRAGRVQGAGNVLNVEENKRIAEESERVRNVYDTLVNRKGPIADALNEAAADYAKAKNKKEREGAKQRALEAVRSAVFAEAGVGTGQPATQPGATQEGGGGGAGTGPAEPRTEPAAAPAPDAGRADTGAAGVTEKPKVEYVRAAAGGQVSEVDGKFYAGGQLMPVHGQYSGQERGPGKAGAGPAPSAEESKGRERKPAQPLTPEQIEERRAEVKRREDIDTLKGGPLEALVGINQGTGKPFRSEAGWNQWKEFAETAGNDKLEQIAAALKPTDPDELEQYNYQLNHPQGFKNASFARSKGHHKEFPASAEAHAAVSHATYNAKTIDDLRRIHDVLTGTAAEPAQPAAPAAAAHPAVASALQRYDARGDLPAVGGALFGGDDARAREGFGKLPDGAEVVITEGPRRGETARIRHEQSLDGSRRIVAQIGSDPHTTPVSPTAVEPLNDLHSWRTEIGAQPKRQGGMFGGVAELPRGQSEAEKASSAVAGELNALARSGQDAGTVRGVKVERAGLGRWRVTVGGKKLEGDQRQAADWIAAEAERKGGAAAPKPRPPGVPDPGDTLAMMQVQSGLHPQSPEGQEADRLRAELTQRGTTAQSHDEVNALLGEFKGHLDRLKGGGKPKGAPATFAPAPHRQRAIDAARTVGEKIYAASAVDVDVFDDLVGTPQAEAAGLEHNEALRTLDSRYRSLKGSNAADPKRVNASMDDTKALIKRRADSLRKLGKTAEADWYEKTGLPMVEEARADLLGGGKPKPAPSVVDAFHRLNQSGDNRVSLADLHDALGHTDVKDTHAVVNDLRRAGVLAASSFEGRHGSDNPKDARDLAHAIRTPGTDEILSHVSLRPDWQEALRDYLAKRGARLSISEEIREKVRRLAEERRRGER